MSRAKPKREGRPPIKKRLPTPLDRWFDAHPKVTVAAFAEDTGVSVKHIYALRRGMGRPSLACAALIETATAGAVPASSWAKVKIQERVR